MSCQVNIFDVVLSGETPGGVLSYDFYDVDLDGIGDPGGSVIFIDANGAVDFNGAIAGDYYFSYTVGEGACEETIQFFIRVLDQVDAGLNGTINVCVGDPIINLLSILNGTPDTNGVWSGDINNINYDANLPNDPTDDTFNPVEVGLFVFTYTVSQIAPNGFSLSDCENCDAKTATVTINVTTCGAPSPCDSGLPNAIQVCSIAGCTFDLFDQLLGTPEVNGQWILLPGSPQQILPTAGYLGTVNFIGATTGIYNYQYDLSNVDPTCTNNTVVTVQVVAQPWAGNNVSVLLCEIHGNTNLFPFITGSPNSGGTFSISPDLPVGVFTINGFINPAVGDAGVYTVTYTVENPTNGPCAGNCIDTSVMTLTISAGCNSGTPSGLVICSDDSLTLNASTLLGGDLSGQWLVVGQANNCNGVYSATSFSVNGGPVQNQQSQILDNGDVISNFANLGCIKFTYFCGGVCLETTDFILQIVSCAPACNASVTISAVACNLSSIITGTCPTPIYLWQLWTGSTWINAPGTNNLSTYTGQHNQRYRLRVTNCTNCNAIFSNEIIVSCPPNSCVITCDSFVYNVALQRLEAQWTHNNGDGNGVNVQYWFNKCTTAASPCNTCNAWGVNQGGGTGNNGTVGTFAVAQTAAAQCWRIVIQDLPTPPLCQVVCYVTIPALATDMCYEILDLQPFTDVTQLIVNVGAGDINILGTPQFGCTEYESTQPVGNVNGTINCSFAQLVIDINQWLVANAHTGTASIRQQGKSSTIRIKDTDVVFKRIVSITYGIKNFQAFPLGCQLCDPMPVYHFQGVGSFENFPSIGYLNPSVPGTINAFDMLDLYVEEIPHTGTFTPPICTGVVTGCVELTTNCCNAGASPITITNNIGFADHGDISWIAFTPPPPQTKCEWTFRYLVTLQNGCEECFNVTIKFNDDI